MNLNLNLNLTLIEQQQQNENQNQELDSNSHSESDSESESESESEFQYSDNTLSQVINNNNEPESPRSLLHNRNEVIYIPIIRNQRRRLQFTEISQERSNYERLARERTEYENYIYDILVNPIIIIPDESDTFWDPVVVSLNDIEKLETVVCENIECLICTEKCNIFKKVICCNNKICLECANNWFEKSVYCPFCKHDQREMSDLSQNKESS